MDEENKELDEEINEIPEESEDLSDDDIDDVSGGRGGEVFYAGSHAGVKRRPWEIIDAKNGDVIKRCKTREDAIDYAIAHGRSTDTVDWGEVCRRRRHLSSWRKLANWLDEEIFDK